MAGRLDSDVPKKRINIYVPVELHERIKAYASTVNMSVSSAFCVFADLQLNALNAVKVNSEAEEIQRKLENLLKEAIKLKDIYDSKSK